MVIFVFIVIGWLWCKDIVIDNFIVFGWISLLGVGDMVNDSMIGMFGVLLLFMIKDKKGGEFLLNWK